jgi:DNA topoisomerase-3
MRVVLAEKPSVALELAKALGCKKREHGYFSGPALLVTFAVGHLVRLAEPNEMNPTWGKPWRRDALPMLPVTWSYIPEPRTEDQFTIVSRLFHDPRVTEIVNATDAGREGENIFRRIYELSGSTKPVLRFWTSSLTEEAIAAAWKSLRPAHEYDNLGAAAQARAQLDWLIGMNHTRASTLHNGILCSVGRVQTPTLAMIVRRHHEIANWVRTFYYEVHAEIPTPEGPFIARALNKAGRHDFEQREPAEAVLADCPEGTPALVTAVEVKPRRTPPPQLHNLGELQKEANRRFGLGADRTLSAAQALYERKSITYPRSSSRYLSEDMVGSLAGVLGATRLPGRDALVAAALKRAQSGPRLSKRFVDGSKLSDHHAIIPTAKGAPAGLPPDESKIFQIVAERFVSIFLPDKETEETRIDLDIGAEPQATHRFRARGSRLVAAGWTAISGNQREAPAAGEDVEDAQSLPEVHKGQQLAVLDSELVTKERKPPARYTDATLLGAMETAGKDIDDDALREAMRGRGLGTEATRAATINRLLELDYIVREGKNFEPTGKGIALIAQVLPHLASPELTGDMEARLGEVEAGKLSADTLLAETAEALRRDIPAVFGTSRMEAAAAPPITAKKGELLCPKCRAGLLSQKPGHEFFGCSRFREGCSFTLKTTVAQKKLTQAQVGKLLGGKHRTEVIRGFKSKAGKSFDALLWLNPANDWSTEFEFERS